MKTTALHDRRVWLVGGAVVALLLVAASWSLAISPKLDNTSQLRDQATNSQTQNDVLAAKNAKLAQLDQKVDVLRAKLAAACQGLPSGSGLPALTHEITALAKDKKIGLTSISVGNVSAAGAADGSGSTPVTTSDPASSSGASSPPAATPPAPSQYTIPVTVQSSGPMSAQVAFVRALENAGRHALVTSTNMTTSQTSRIASLDAASTMTTQLTVFSAPMSASQSKQLSKLLGSDC